MRSQFPGYYRPSERELAQLWRDATFVFDANVILSVYRYTPQTRDELFKILEAHQDRLWIPHQTGLEYQRNRLEVISIQARAYDAIIDEFQKTINRLENFLRAYQPHPALEADRILAEIKRPLGEWLVQLEKTKAAHPDLLSEDPLRNRITEIFDSRVGSPYTIDQLEALYKRADQRYRNRVPPGYLDEQKGSPGKYGDFVLWSQMLDYIRSGQHHVIFVTEDRKEDWWLRHDGKTIGPRPELVQELLTEGAAGFYMYQTDQFMLYARRYLRTATRPADLRRAVKEVQDVRQRDETVGELVKALDRLTPSLTTVKALQDAARLATPSAATLGAWQEAVRAATPTAATVKAWQEAVNLATPSTAPMRAWYELLRLATASIPQTSRESIPVEKPDVQGADEEKRQSGKA